ncbi:unnamed protein product [Closterium sp. NIES-53]
MGEQELVTDYYNRARRILAEMQIAGAENSTASYISHIVKDLPRGYNLMKRMMMVPGTRESLDEDSITSYILQDEAMQEAERPTELLPQVNYASPTKLNQQQGQRRKPGEGGSGGGRSTMDVAIKRSMRDKGREYPDRADSDEDDTRGRRSRSTSRRPRRDAKPCKEKQTSKKTSSNKDVDNSGGKSRGDGEASCSMVGVAEPTVLLASEAGEDFQAVAAVVQANPMAVLLDSGCSHHLMGTKAVFVDMAPSDGVKHVRGFNGALQPVEGRGTVVLQGEARKRVLIPDVLYVPGIQANLLSASKLKESGVQLKGDGDEMLLVAANISSPRLGRCSVKHTTTDESSAPTFAPGRCNHRRPSVETIKSSAKHKVATGLDITLSTRAEPPCVLGVGGKLARHTFPDKGSDAEEALAVVHVDLCGPFRVAAKDGSLFFLLLKDRHTRFVWVMPVAKKSDVLREFQKWLVLVERQAKKSVLMLRLEMGGEFCWCNPTVCIRLVVRVRACVCAWNEPLGAVSTMAGPEERGGRGAGGSGEAQAQGQPRDSAMAPMQPSLGPPRDEPRVFGLDKFNGDNFAEWSFKMENIFDHYDLLEVMEGMEKRPENDPEKSPWVQKSAQGYLLLGQALGSSQIRHIKPFQREPEKGPKAWAALKGVHAPATAAVAVVLERQMAALRIEEDEAVEEGVQKFFDLLTRLEGADLNYMKNEMVAGIRVKGEPDEVLGCPTCMQAKFTHYTFSSSEATAKAPLDEVVMDVVGPLKLGASGAEYFLTIVDVYTRMNWVYVLSKKSDVAETVKTDWLPMVERQQDQLVKAIRTN